MLSSHKARRHDERRVLVLDQEGHHLHDRVLDGLGQVHRLIPVDRGVGVPQIGRRLRVQPRRLVTPDLEARGQSEVEGGASGFDERAPGREPPGARRLEGTRDGQAQHDRAHCSRGLHVFVRQVLHEALEPEVLVDVLPAQPDLQVSEPRRPM